MLKRLWASERGNFALPFAIAMVPMMIGVAGAIDFVGTSNDAEKLQNALDAAGLAIGTKFQSGMTTGEVQQFGQTFFAANLPTAGTQDLQLYYADSIAAFQAAASGDHNAYYISVSSSIKHPGFVSGSPTWQANRSSNVKVAPGTQACVLALDPHASSSVSLQGSTDVSMASCVIASNSDATDSVYRGGSAQITAACVSTVGGSAGLSDSSASLTCGTPLEHQYASFDPLADVSPPPYTFCQSLPNGKTISLSPGTFCDTTWSGNITLDPGVYILRGGKIKLGGDGSLVGHGVTIFLMEGAQFVANANDKLDLSPPTSGPYAGITIFQDRGNTYPLTVNGGAGSLLSGFIYAPDAPITYAGNSDMSAEGECLRIVGKTVEMTGNSSVKSDCTAELGNREMYAGRTITLVK